MSDQGFHEIQLSGKQLVFLFMSTVVLAVVIFLLGVAVGRSVRDAAGDAPVSADAGLPETVVPDDAAADPNKAADPELSYHEMLLGAPGGTPATPPAPAPTPTPTATPAPAPETTPASPEARLSGWFLQTGAYSTRSVADGQVAKLTQLKVPAFVLVPAASAPDRLFRVRIGPYADRAEAAEVMTRLQRQGFTPSITR
ncbi:MAG: SPOR domain-containing protein [Acidobacteria bacterium]|nr:SPOR domain-containing protein [Acidobacteriota bacterium]